MHPPLPTDPTDAQRVLHTRMRRAMLYGQAEPYYEARLAASIPDVQRRYWGPLDDTANPFSQVWSQAACLYSSEPTVSPPPGGEAIAEMIAASGYWSLMQRVQRDTLGLREMMVRVSTPSETEQYGLRLHPVPPDLLEVEVDSRRPNRAVAVREWVEDPDLKNEWVQLVYDPRAPSYRAIKSDGTDVSERVLGQRYDGADYPWIVASKPVLPWVAYRAAETGFFWDPYTGREVVAGTLQLAVDYTYYSHILRHAAWAQRYAINAAPVGSATDAPEGKEPARETVTDPASLLLLETSVEGAGQPSAGAFPPPLDPKAVLESIRMYEDRLIDMSMTGAQVSRATSDIRSGYSLAVSREAQRSLQRSYEPVFRRSDIELLSLVSGLQGGPTDGWRITYAGIPRDPAEEKADLDRIMQQIEMGVLDRVTAYQQIHPGLSRDEARTAIEEIAASNAELSGTVAPSTESSVEAPASTAPVPTIMLTSTDIAGIVTVDEARRSQGLPPLGTPEGKLTVTEFQARNAAIVAKAANAAAGQPTTEATNG